MPPASWKRPGVHFEMHHFFERKMVQVAPKFD
jgi:hypothetical protein